MTCSFHAPEEGDDYQLPDGAGDPAARGRSRASRRRSPSTSASSAPPSSGGRHLPVHAPLLVPHPRGAARRPGAPRLRAGLLLRHDRRRLSPAEPGHMGDPHRRQPRSRRLVPPALAGRRLEPLRPAGAGQRGRPRHHPRHHARRGRHAAPEHGAGAADPRSSTSRMVFEAPPWLNRDGSVGRSVAMGLLDGQERRRDRRRLGDRAGPPAAAWPRRGRGSPCSTSTGSRPRRWRSEIGGVAFAVDVGDPDALARRRRRGRGRAGRAVHHLQQRRAPPPSTGCTSWTPPSGTGSCGST